MVQKVHAHTARAMDGADWGDGRERSSGLVPTDVTIEPVLSMM